ncbi:STY4199 family HEPN domain-containing protein, partial [Salmonella enterica subsp. enterica serovar Anatum]|nr:STY4199 family HEPN domain-containing protein [Salmonella enterica subsp. enterica serovar Anatum]
DRLRQWLKQGEDQHALEGMLFSELALMVVDKKLFARHYVRIFRALKRATAISAFFIMVSPYSAGPERIISYLPRPLFSSPGPSL